MKQTITNGNDSELFRLLCMNKLFSLHFFDSAITNSFDGGKNNDSWNRR